jgi:hypothetical protein
MAENGEYGSADRAVMPDQSGPREASPEDALLCQVEGCARTVREGIPVAACGLNRLAPQTIEQALTELYRTPIVNGRRLCHAEAICDLWEAEGVW